MGLVTANTIVGGYSRLKGLMRSGINLGQLDKAVHTAKNTTIGNLPKDLLNLIIKAHPEQKGEMIKSAQGTFDSVAKILGNLEQAQQSAVERFAPTLENAVKIFKEEGKCFEDKIFKENLASISGLAEKQMLGDLQKILPELNDVKISLVGFGSYGQVFKLEFLDKNGEKLVKDRAMKIFRKDGNTTINMFQTIGDVVNSHSAEDICRFAKKSGVELDESDVTMAQGMYGVLSDAVKNAPKEAGAVTTRMHGANAEANISEYIRFHSGHKVLPQEGLVLPDMIKLGEKPYQISEFIGKDTLAKRTFDFDRLGLMHTDLNSNPNNLLNGSICIDLGGVTPAVSVEKYAKAMEDISKKDMFEEITPKGMGDKLFTRLMKRFSGLNPQQKTKYLDMLEQEAKSTKDLIKRSKLTDFIKDLREKMSCNGKNMLIEYAKQNGIELSDSFLKAMGQK